jgi:serine/threonine protein kinase
MTLSEGAVLLGRYQIERQIGSGGMATVYEAIDKLKQCRCAIKELMFSYWPQSGRQRLIDAFLEEARSLSRIKHPNLPEFYDYLQLNDDYYLVMEFIQGDDLAKRIDQEGRQTEEDVLRWMNDVMDALKVCHAENLIHRDIKPDNIKVTDDHAYLLDFGVARQLLPEDDKTLPAQSREYSPLENFGPSPRFEKSSDIYSLGATMYILLTGERPVHSIDRALGVEMASLHDWKLGISEAVDQAVMKALAIKPKDRYQSVEEFQKGLSQPVTAGIPQPQGVELAYSKMPELPPEVVLPRMHALLSTPAAAQCRIDLGGSHIPCAFAVGPRGKVFLGWPSGQVSQYCIENGKRMLLSGSIPCKLAAQSISAYQGGGNDGISCVVFSKEGSTPKYTAIPGSQFSSERDSEPIELTPLPKDVRLIGCFDQEQYLLYSKDQQVSVGRHGEIARELIPGCGKAGGLAVMPNSFFVAGTILASEKKRCAVWFWDRNNLAEWRLLQLVDGEMMAIAGESVTKHVFVVARTALMITVTVYDTTSGEFDGTYRLDGIQDVQAIAADPKHLWVLTKQALYRLPTWWLAQKRML